MKLVDLFWKSKRFFRRRKELIGRIFSIVLTVGLLAIVAYAAKNIYESDKVRKEKAQAEKISYMIVKEDLTYKPTNIGDKYFTEVATNGKLTLSANFDTGEIRIEDQYGKKWYSNPQDRRSVNTTRGKTKLGAQLLVNFVNMELGNDAFLDNYSQSILKGTMYHDFVYNEEGAVIGVKFIFGFMLADVYIPVQYILTDDGFKAEVVVNEIESIGDPGHMVDSIALLPFFGAGTETEDGYLFVPDGSGSLIEFNGGKDNMQAYEERVYGNNLTTFKRQESVRQTVRLPIFGAKVENNAFLGVITHGDATSSIAAASLGQMNGYNVVYSKVHLSEHTKKKTSDHTASKSSFSIDYRDNLTEGQNYCVQYFFLEGDDANYVGMSNCYRDYLEKNNLIKDSKLTDKKYMVIDLIGAVSIKKYVMGVKTPVVTALTTYNDVVEIVKELKSKGVENLIVNYIGAMDSGLNNEVYDCVKVESALGSKKEFRNMVQYLKDQGVQLFIESNPVDIYEDGNGYKENKDSVKTWYDAYAFQYQYFLDTNASVSGSRWHLLRPQLVTEAVASFADSMGKWQLGNMAIDRVGNVLYGDYDEAPGMYISRVAAKNLWIEMLQKTAEKLHTAQTPGYLMLHGGNAYTTTYADIITDIDDSHSSFDTQDWGVPFYQITFQDNTLLTSRGINTTVDYRQAFLKAIETGTSLKYNMIYGDISSLVGTDYNTMVSYSYSYWKDLAVEQYLDMQEKVGHLTGQRIVNHMYLAEDVTLTQFETGSVVVNYGTETFVYGDKEVPAEGYLVI